MSICIHNSILHGKCANPAFAIRTHGWLCAGHYQQEQASIPAKPRLPQPKWLGYAPLQSDEQIIASIITADTQAIAAGRVMRIRRGALDPVYLRVLEPVVVH